MRKGMSFKSAALLVAGSALLMGCRTAETLEVTEAQQVTPAVSALNSVAEVQAETDAQLVHPVEAAPEVTAEAIALAVEEAGLEIDPASGLLIVEGAGREESAEVASSVEPQPVMEVEVTGGLEELLMRDYTFDEVSSAVKDLQIALGGIAIDSHYGAQTRAAHLAALEAHGLSTNHVPAPATSLVLPVSEECLSAELEARPKYVVGDSLSVGVENTGFKEQAFESCLNLMQYDARSGRQTYEAETVVASWGTLPPDSVVLVALGTNDIWGTAESFSGYARRVLNAIGDRDVIWIDVSEGLPGPSDHINNAIATLAAEYPRMTVADWSAYEEAHNVIRAGDGVHYSGTQYVKRASFYYELLQSYDN